MINLALKATKVVFLKKVSNIFMVDIVTPRGPGSVDGIKTGYELDGPGIESRWGRDFPHMPRPALAPLSLL